MEYALPVSGHFLDLHITQLEMLNVVVALKVLANLWQNKKVEIHCDNLSVVEIINSSNTRDKFLALCARNVWLVNTMSNIHLVGSHIPEK